MLFGIDGRGKIEMLRFGMLFLDRFPQIPSDHTEPLTLISRIAREQVEGIHGGSDRELSFHPAHIACAWRRGVHFSPSLSVPESIRSQ